jgi:hypothetical protein
MTGGAVRAQRDPSPQLLVFAGGPLSAPGYDFHAFRSTSLVTQHLEWRVPVPFVGIPLGRWGRIPGQARLAPFVHAVFASRGVAGAFAEPGQSERVTAGYQSGWYPSVGIGAFSFFDLLRLDVGRGLRNGRWTVSLDINRDFWSIL